MPGARRVGFDPRLPDTLVAGWDRLSDRLRGDAALLRQGLLRWPWWVQVLTVWLVTRGYAVWLTVLAGATQQDTPFSRAGDGYFEMADSWDSAFYATIHDHGYPSELPRDESGRVEGSPWAFLPLYPLLVRVVTSLTGLGWTVAAPLVSTAASIGFVLVCYRLFRLRADAVTSLMGVVVISVWPAAPVLQYAYAESLAMLLVAVLLHLLASGRYGWAVPVVVLAGLSRPLAAPLAAACVLLAGLVVRAHRRDGLRLPRGQALALGALVVVSVAAVALWPGIAAVVTGEPTAYFLTEAAWHSTSQLTTSVYLLSFLQAFGPLAGATAAVLLGLAAVVMLASRGVRALGAPAWAWSVAYLAYLFALVGWEPPLPRLLLLAFPLALPLAAASRARPYRTLLVVSLAALQALWVFLLWRWVTWVNLAP
jgi:hypothetical protein